MAKTGLTRKLEQEIWRATHKTGVFACFEVTIGWYGRERVDYMTYDTKGVFRCFEIKVSKPDFRSKAHNTFLGHFNYYVMTKELYEEVKDEIPAHVGVYVEGRCAKKAKKQELKADEQVLKDSLIRSLYRDVEKQLRSDSPHIVDGLNRQIAKEKRRADQHCKAYWELRRRVEEKFGYRWYKEGAQHEMGGIAMIEQARGLLDELHSSGRIEYNEYSLLWDALDIVGEGQKEEAE